MSARLWLIAWLAAGCGRLGFDDMPPPPPIVIDGELPMVCATHPFDAVAIASPDVDVSVAATPDGATLAWVDRSDGLLYGLTVANDWSITTDPAGTMMKTGTWLGAAIGYADGMVVASELESGSSIKLDTVQDLSSTEFGCPMANFAPKPPMLHAGADLVTPTLFDDGLSVWPVTGWTQAAASVAVPTAGATGIAATPIGSLAELVWSNASTCYFETLSDAATGVGSQRGVPCASPRVATDGTSLALIFESAQGVELVIGDPATIDPSAARVLAPGATSPRITYDGARYWFGYLDASAVPTVGYLDSLDVPRVVAVTLDQAPKHDAFELAIVNGQPTLVTTQHATTLVAFDICTP